MYLASCIFESLFLFDVIILNVVWLFLVQGACVENTLDSVIMSLLRNPNRKFVFAEMVNF